MQILALTLRLVGRFAVSIPSFHYQHLMSLPADDYKNKGNKCPKIILKRKREEASFPKLPSFCCLSVRLSCTDLTLNRKGSELRGGSGQGADS